MQALDSLLRKLDALQRGRPWLAFPFAVFKKFSDDGGGRLAALIAYYGFFSLFPLLLALTTLLEFFIQGNEKLQDRIIESALARFPVVGPQISSDIQAIKGNGLVLVLGLGAALWAGLGVVQTAQHAMNVIWDVPEGSRPNYLTSRLRSVLMLVVAGVALVGAAVLSGLASADVARLVTLTGSLALPFAVFLVAFRLLTTAEITWRDVFPGAAAATVLWTILQLVGGYYVSRVVANASQVYGFFAIVIGLL